MQQVINFAVPAEAYVYRLFRPSGGWLMSVVPALIAFAFVWTVADLILKYRVALKTEADLNRPEVKQLPALVAQEAPNVTRQRLRAWDRNVLSRPVGRRVLWLLQHLATTDPQRAHELVRHQSDLDADSAASSYRAVKLFIWAMPILGFIGTVLGISLAVGGFSDFLTTSVSIEEIDRVTQELGNVASGLSFAFDTTLLGLLGGLVSSVVSSVVQSREERLLTRLEEMTLRVMESAMPVTSTAPAAGAAAGASLSTEAFEAAMRARMNELTVQMQHFHQTVNSGLDGLGEASARMSRGLETSIGAVSRGLETSVGAVSRTVETLGGSVAGLGEHVDEVSTSLEERISSMEEANRRLESAISSLAPMLGQLAGPLEVRLVAASAVAPVTPRGSASAEE